MRASLRHPISERRVLRRRRRGRYAAPHTEAVLATGRAAQVPGPSSKAPAPAPRVRSAPATDRQGSAPDLALRRARAAGGPVDQASYSCSCGYVFAAAVSTSVACPVCGCAQAW